MISLPGRPPSSSPTSKARSGSCRNSAQRIMRPRPPRTTSLGQCFAGRAGVGLDTKGNAFSWPSRQPAERSPPRTKQEKHRRVAAELEAVRESSSDESTAPESGAVLGIARPASRGFVDGPVLGLNVDPERKGSGFYTSPRPELGSLGGCSHRQIGGRGVRIADAPWFGSPRQEQCRKCGRGQGALSSEPELLLCIR